MRQLQSFFGVIALSGASLGLAQGQDKPTPAKAVIPALRIAQPGATAGQTGSAAAPATATGKALMVLRNQFSVSQSTILVKLRQTDNDEERFHEEIKKLRKENYQLTQERDILKKAAAYFAKQTL